MIACNYLSLAFHGVYTLSYTCVYTHKAGPQWGGSHTLGFRPNLLTGGD